MYVGDGLLNATICLDVINPLRPMLAANSSDESVLSVCGNHTLLSAQNSLLQFHRKALQIGLLIGFEIVQN